MRIAILGTGALATVYGVYLHGAGHEVTVIGRRDSLAQVRNHGLRLHDLDGREITARVEVLDLRELAGGAVPAASAFDYLMVCTKAIDTAGQLSQIRGLAPAAVLSIQNGVLKDDVLRAAFPSSRLIGAATLVSATRNADGSATLVNRSTTLLVSGDPPCRNALPVAGDSHAGWAAALATALQQAGLPAQLVPDRLTLLWSKAAYTAAGFGASILTRLDVGRILSAPTLRGLFLDLVREGAATATAQGMRPDDYPGLPARSLAELPRDEALALLAAMGERLSGASVPLRVSMLQDLDAGRPTEAEEVLAPLIEIAHGAGLAVPLLECAYRVVSGIEEIGHASPGSNTPTASSTA